MMQRAEILRWLGEAEEQRLEALWARADAVRRAQVGDAVHLRGLIEISNCCVRRCTYCGLRAEDGGAAGLGRRLARYRLTPEEVLACAHRALELGYGTVVLQAGEDPALTRGWVAEVVRRIKRETGLAVTLSLGERDEDTLRAWRAAGADRYLLRFETSNLALFDRIHPARDGHAGANGRGAAIDGRVAGDPCGQARLALLPVLRGLGYEVGSGVMIGIPGQSYDDLANDIELFRELDLDMIGVGPWLPHPDTPLGRAPAGAAEPNRAVPNRARQEAAGGANAGLGAGGIAGNVVGGSRSLTSRIAGNVVGGSRSLTSRIAGNVAGGSRSLTVAVRYADGRGAPAFAQVPNTELMTYKVVALARLVCPRANIPSTTALASLNRDRGRELGLQRGANVIMPNLTPPQYRRLYEVYPAKACNLEEPGRFHVELVRRIEALGRHAGAGPGTSPNWHCRQTEKGERPGRVGTRHGQPI